MIGVALLSFLAGFSGAIVPGPLFALTINQALLSGWSAGLWLITGHMLSELSLVLLLRFGLGELLKRPRVTRVIALVGGLVLLYFAWDMMQTARLGIQVTGNAGVTTALSIPMLIGRGFLLTIVNPYWYLWWATAGVGLIAAQVEKYGAHAWSAFYIGHSLADYVWYLGVSLLIAGVGAFLTPTVHRGLIFVCGCGIALLGLLFLLHPVREWWKGRQATAS